MNNWRISLKMPLLIFHRKSLGSTKLLWDKINSLGTDNCITARRICYILPASRNPDISTPKRRRGMTLKNLAGL